VSDLATYYDESYPPSIYAPPVPPVPDPTITTLAPSTAVAGSGPVTVTVTGTNFLADSVVEADQAALVTTFVSATSLTASYDPATAGTVRFTVRNGGAGGEESNGSDFVVTVAEEPEA
jgi:hypothetical protein